MIDCNIYTLLATLMNSCRDTPGAGLLTVEAWVAQNATFFAGVRDVGALLLQVGSATSVALLRGVQGPSGSRGWPWSRRSCGRWGCWSPSWAGPLGPPLLWRTA